MCGVHADHFLNFFLSWILPSAGFILLVRGEYLREVTYLLNRTYFCLFSPSIPSLSHMSEQKPGEELAGSAEALAVLIIFL